MLLAWFALYSLAAGLSTSVFVGADSSLWILP
jgi:hypothetical protein